MGRIQDQLGVYQPSAGTAGIADDASPNEQRAALRAARAAARAAAKE